MGSLAKQKDYLNSSIFGWFFSVPPTPTGSMLDPHFGGTPKYIFNSQVKPIAFDS